VDASSSFQCNHWVPLVVLSYTISVLGAYCSLQWASQIPHSKGWRLALWLSGASLAMGGGAIWSMHFIAMLACRLPVRVAYDVRLTLASLLVAILVTGVGLGTVGVGRPRVHKLLAGGAFTGLGVAGMHYTGMAAMRLPAQTTYRPALVLASVLIAIVAATAALWIAFNMRGALQRLSSSLVMGVAVCGMHYTAMAAAEFVPSAGAGLRSPSGLEAQQLGFMVFAITLFVLLLLSAGQRMVQRGDAQEALRQAHEELRHAHEELVERTAELARANVELHAENVERRRAEELLEKQRAFLRQVIDVDPSLIFAKDRDGRFTLVNQACAEMYGTTVEALVGKRDADFDANTEEVSAFRQADLAVMTTGRAMLIPEEPITDSKGKVHWLQTVKVPIVGRDGSADQVLGVSTDITNRKNLEEQLRQSHKMEAVGTLAGGIAHDFNNLLTTVLGYSDLVLNTLPADSPHRADIREVAKAGERAAALTRQLLAFSRKQFVEPKVLDLNVVVADMETMLRRLIGADIQLETLMEPSLGRVKADRVQIEQALMNLVVNARDAMPRGGNLTIETRNVELTALMAHGQFRVEPGRYVLLATSDTGVGIDGDTRARIFEPFFTTKEKGRGTGLGLSTVYGIVQQSGGSLWLDSEPGRGSKFTIYLPRVEDPLGVVEARDAPPVGGRETILLVEDEDAVRRLAFSVLSEHGYTVLEAKDGDEAMRLIECGGMVIDMVLTDGVMPGMPVSDLVGKIRSALPGARILLMSGYTGEAILRRGILESDMPFLEKPFTSGSLLRKVRTVLDARRGP
jgi:PAS domain S-box-containing protein